MKAEDLPRIREVIKSWADSLTALIEAEFLEEL